MARVCADHADSALPANDLAVFAEFLNRCANFHIKIKLNQKDKKLDPKVIFKLMEDFV